MEQELQLKPFKKTDGFKYKILEITDLTLHTSNKRPTISFGKEMKKVLTSDEPGRVYGTIHGSYDHNDKKVLILDILKQDPEFIAMIREEEKNGYKILLHLPSQGVPILAGKDTLEFMNSRNGKRVLRGLAKSMDKNKI